MARSTSIGPGPHAPDGSPVELYALLPPRGEAELIHGAVGAGCEILELGCGTGRITRGLIALGHPVVAVDNSPEMLAHVNGAETVLADMATLRLSRRFGAVVLASNFINDRAPQRSQYLETCRYHLADAGSVLIERLDPRWADPAWGLEQAKPRSRDGITGSLQDVRVKGSLFSATARYEVEGRVWTQSFTLQVLTDRDVRRALMSAGLRVKAWLDEDRIWLQAGPSRASSASTS